MQVFTLVLAVFAAMALSSPVEKRGRRGFVTKMDIVTVTEYTTIDSLPTSTGAHKHNRPVAAVASASLSSSSTAPFVAPAPTTSAAPVSSSSAEVEPVHSTAAATSSVAPPPPPPSSSSPPASSAAAAAPASSGASDFQTLVLDSHNIHRANHSAVALTWDDDLASIAAQIAASCVYAHNTQAGGGGYGQNIGAGLQATEVDKMVTNMMYNGEIGFYPGYGNDNPDMSNFEKWGHFSQIVWKNTLTIGCAVQICSSLANVGSDIPPIFTVCNFKPPGNFAGQYTNVGPPLGQPMVVA